MIHAQMGPETACLAKHTEHGEPLASFKHTCTQIHNKSCLLHSFSPQYASLASLIDVLDQYHAVFEFASAFPDFRSYSVQYDFSSLGDLKIIAGQFSLIAEANHNLNLQTCKI